MIKRTGFGWSVDVPGFDVESLAVAIDRGDVDRVSALLDDLSKALEGEGSRLYTIAAVSGILAHLYRRGGRVQGERRQEEAFLNAARDACRCSDRQAAFGVLKQFCLRLGTVGRRDVPRYSDRQGYLRRALEYMRRAYSDPGLKLEEVAQYAYISASYLARLLRQEMDTTFSALLTRIRMEAAARMLEENDLQNYEIAARCGFANATYFSKVFRKHFGVAPSEYRKQREVKLGET